MNPRLVTMTAMMAMCSILTTSTRAVAGDDSDEEQSLVRHGTECFMRRDYECARTAIGQAYALHPSADHVLKLGLAELQSGHPVEAVAHLREYLTHTQEPPAKLNAVRTTWLPRAEASTARLDVFAPTGAHIFIDGSEPPPSSHSSPATIAALSIVVAAGSHDITSQNGTVVETRHITAHGGELVEIHFQRVPDAHAAAASGPEFRASAKDDVYRFFVQPEWRAILGLGAAASVAVGFTIAYDNYASQASSLVREFLANTYSASSLVAPYPQTRSAIDAQHRDAALATGFYVRGEVAAMTAATTWLLWPGHGESAPPVAATPLVSLSGAGLALNGVW
jgi:hypothetical protein